MSLIKLNFFTKNILVSVLVSKKFYSLGLGLESFGLDYITDVYHWGFRVKNSVTFQNQKTTL